MNIRSFFRADESAPNSGSSAARALLCAASLAVAVCSGCAYPRGGSGSGGYFNSYINQPPPELSADGVWINSEETLSLAALQGRVVWLEFSFLQ